VNEVIRYRLRDKRSFLLTDDHRPILKVKRCIGEIVRIRRVSLFHVYSLDIQDILTAVHRSLSDYRFNSVFKMLAIVNV